jgi:DNA-binding MurR/RpiR family transcriptional regulator
MLALAAPGDVVVAFSFPPYTRETVDAAAFVQQRNVPVIALTDAMTSPITFRSSEVIVVRTKNMLYTNSVAAIITVLNALVTDIALRNRAKVTVAMKHVAKAMDESGQYLRKA